MADAAEDGEDKREGCGAFCEDAAHAGTVGDALLDQWQVEHGMREDGAEDAACDLEWYVQRCVGGTRLAAQEHHQRYGGIEVRAGDRAEDCREYVENGGGRQRVAEERDTVIAG